MRSLSGIKSLIEGQVWVIDPFLNKANYKSLVRSYCDADIEMLHVNNKDMKPLMADTDMSYRVKSIDHFPPIYDSIEKHLNIKLPERQSNLAMQYKRFMRDDSYDLHAEDKRIYGDWVYIMYLTNETDGRIIFPSEQDHISSDGFVEMQEMFDITFAPQTVSYTPKANTCVVMKTGIAHMVEPCSGRRDSIAGWPGFVPSSKR